MQEKTEPSPRMPKINSVEQQSEDHSKSASTRLPPNESADYTTDEIRFTPLFPFFLDSSLFASFFFPVWTSSLLFSSSYVVFALCARCERGRNMAAAHERGCKHMEDHYETTYSKRTDTTRITDCIVD